jgi:hypothetical protein
LALSDADQACNSLEEITQQTRHNAHTVVPCVYPSVRYLQLGGRGETAA